MNIKSMYMLTLCALSMSSAQIGAKAYSEAEAFTCNTVYPTEVYCEDEKKCEFFSSTCIIKLDGSPLIGGSSITEELYKLNVPNFEKITLTKSDKLPFSQYPKLNQQLAYELTATKGKFPNIPFRIVIQTEVPNDAFIGKIERGIKTLKDQELIYGAKKLVNTLKNLKNNNQGVNVIYRSVPAFGETQYKLYYVRVPGSQPGYIVGRTDGDLEIHEQNKQDANKEYVTVIDTGVLM